MTPSSIGPPSGDDELLALAGVLNRTYLRTPEEGDAWLKRVQTDALRVVRSGGRVAGGLRLMPMAQWYGGRQVAMTGVASVGIDPEHRASGLASSLMRSVLEEMHGAGAATSVLYPATQPVYRRVGYELAGTWIRYKLPCASIDTRDRELDVRRLDPDAALDVVEPMYTERARRTSGNLSRPDDLWARMLASEPDEAHVYSVGPASGSEGYVVFSQRRDQTWKYDLVCHDVVALTPGAGRRILTFFADHRSFSRDVIWTAGPVDPLLYLLREQDWQTARSWQWMLRIVDVRSALAARGYPDAIDTELHLEVRDDVLPWNHGRFVLDVAGGKGKVRKGGRGRVGIDVRGLASLYTGFAGAAELRSTGYLDGTDRDLALATTVFAGPSPWLADFF